MSLKWERNASTGNSIARTSPNVRVIRMEWDGSYVYVAENWGDYGPSFPVRSRPKATVSAALKEVTT